MIKFYDNELAILTLRTANLYKKQFKKDILKTLNIGDEIETDQLQDILNLYYILASVKNIELTYEDFENSWGDAPLFELITKATEILPEIIQVTPTVASEKK